MSNHGAPFLTASWRHLAMLNYDIAPEVLRPFVPAGTELDDWQGRTFASLVGFRFLDTRVLGVAIPFHRDFDEVNLRFYVRCKAADGWRRAVVFVKEIVPRPMIAWTARALYGENYVTARMSHHIDVDDGTSARPRAVSYSWWLHGRKNRIDLGVDGEPREAAPGSVEEFITEHYWGYARRRGGHTTEYRVEHPRWKVCSAATARLDCDVAGVYGSRFAPFLSVPPASAFLADGSEVTVFKGRRLPA